MRRELLAVNLAAGLLIAGAAGAENAMDKQSGEIRLTAQSLHPLRRETASPTGGTELDVNPPPLLWPAVSGRDVTYDVRLAPDPVFPPATTVSGSGMPWAMFNPHGLLASGRWHWQVRAVTDGVAQAWSEMHEFTVSPAAREFVTPDPAAMISACPRTHPRVLATAAELPSLRTASADSAGAADIIRQAEGLVGAPLVTEDEGVPRRKGSTEAQRKKFATWASKRIGTRMGSTTKTVCMAYLLTGDERFGREAVRRGMHVAGWDPNGVSRVNDFADGACLRAMALAYDTCFELLSPAERETLRTGIRIRAGRFYRRWVNDLETRVFSAHIWQHILHDLVDAAFAVLGEEPEAERWAAYTYELWLNRVPLLGGSDGGWANGNNYFATNMATLIYVPSFFEALAGVDFFQHPWYRNVIAYQIYTFPPGSVADGFGDGSERDMRPGGNRLGFVDLLGRRFQDPYAGWYVKTSLAGARLPELHDSAFTWYRLRHAHVLSELPVAAAMDLPQARVFPDTGVVTMHTDLGDTAANLMLAFRSSPYGAHNHMHADQNSFNIIFGGDRVLANSGYYIAYGDNHFRCWYKATVGHNTVLIDGKGQSAGADGYGWIPRFLHGRRISYCVGDAGNAYGESGLTRFRRHVLMLRPATVVILDDLAADHDADWTWLLHGPHEIDPMADRALTTVTPNARARIDLPAADRLRMDVDTAFDPPALNWRGQRDRQGNEITYADQWHVRVSPVSACPAWRLTAVIQIVPKDAPEPTAPRILDDGWIEAAGWRVRSGVVSDRVTLEACSLDGQAAFATGGASAVCAGVAYNPEPAGSSVLVERSGDVTMVRQTVDVTP